MAGTSCHRDYTGLSMIIGARIWIPVWHTIPLFGMKGSIHKTMLPNVKSDQFVKKYHENWMRLVHGVCIWGCWEFDSCHSHTVLHTYYLYTWLNDSCQTISKIPLDSINQTHLILVKNTYNYLCAYAQYIPFVNI